ncbi:type VI secretion system tip protein VgrG, partial [Escherichia coli]|nr:type VI secretion system tip protein VgrG [Escherichia coli]
FDSEIAPRPYRNKQAIPKGQGPRCLVHPGLEIRGQGDDGPGVFRKGVLIPGVTVSAARDRSYELTFTAIPYSERYGYRPALIPRPAMTGTLPPRVTCTVKKHPYAQLDKDAPTRTNLEFSAVSRKPGLEILGGRRPGESAWDPTCSCV